MQVSLQVFANAAGNSNRMHGSVANAITVLGVYKSFKASGVITYPVVVL